MKGTVEQSRGYIMNDDKRTNTGPGKEFGDYKKSTTQGQRKDLESMYNMVKEGKPEYEIWEAHPGTCMRYPKATKYARKVVTRPRWTVRPADLPEPVLIVIWATSGLGKSYTTRLYFGEQAYFTNHGENDHPWDDYEGQKIIVLDEFRDDQWNYKTINSLCDMRLKLLLRCRYENCWANHEKLIMLTNCDPRQWYTVGNALPPELLETVRRRIRGNCYAPTTREEIHEILAGNQVTQDHCRMDIP